MRFLLVLVLIFTVSAAGARERKPGFSANVEIGAVSSVSTDNLKATNNNEVADDLEGEADEYNYSKNFPSIDIAYVMRSRTEIYVNTRAGTGAPALYAGVNFQAGSLGRIDAAYIHGIGGEVWQNPYETGSTRNDTAKDINGAQIEFENFMQSPVRLSLRYLSEDVEKDEVGNQYKKMQRDAASLRTEAGYTLNINNLSIIPYGTYEMHNADGSAQKYTMPGARLTAAYRTKLFMLTGSAALEQADYDSENPIFSKTREDKITTLSGNLRVFNIFGNPKVYLNFFAVTKQRDSNISFYDAKDRIAGASVGYRF